MDSRSTNNLDNEQFSVDAERVRTIDDFKDWTRQSIRPVFPHEALICGQGQMHAAGVGLDYPVQVDCPLTYLQAIRNRAGGWETPIMRRWLLTRQPLSFEAEYPWDDVPAAWLERFREYGLKNAIVHGLFDDERCVATYYCFYGIPGRLTATHAEAMRQLVPVLHEVLCRVIAHIQSDDIFASRFASLSARESEIVRWLRMGKSNDEIAKFSSLSLNTVKHHLTRIFRKLEVDSRSGLLARLGEHEARVATRGGTRIY